MGKFVELRNVRVLAFLPPAVRELGREGRFHFPLEDSGAKDHMALTAAGNHMAGRGAKDPGLIRLRSKGRSRVFAIKVVDS